MAPLYERYRPKTFDDMVAQETAVARVRTIGKAGYGGEAFLITGASGTGKTTLARIIAAEIAHPARIVERNASDLSLPMLRQWEEAAYDGQGYLFGGRRAFGRAYIINEAHALTARTMARLETFLEMMGARTVVILTTTHAAALVQKREQRGLFGDTIEARPLLSRCHAIKLAQSNITAPFAARLKSIAQAEGLDGRPIEDYVKLLRRAEVGNNLRHALELVQEGEMLK